MVKFSNQKRNVKFKSLNQQKNIKISIVLSEIFFFKEMSIMMNKIFIFNKSCISIKLLFSIGLDLIECSITKCLQITYNLIDLDTYSVNWTNKSIAQEYPSHMIGQEKNILFILFERKVSNKDQSLNATKKVPYDAIQKGKKDIQKSYIKFWNI